MSISEQLVTAAFLRGRLAERKLPIFVVAARVRIHPRRIGEMLNEHRALPAEIAVRILQAIEEG